jgi:hypothetical protein
MISEPIAIVPTAINPIVRRVVIGSSVVMDMAMAPDMIAIMTGATGNRR